MRRPTGTLPRRAAAAMLVVAALAACSGSDPEAGRITDTPTPSPTSSPSPTATTPEQQIEATMANYFAATNAAIRSGDVSELKAFSTAGCPCRRAARTIEKTVSSGGHFEGLQYKVTSIQVHDVDGDTAGAEVKATLPPYKVVNGAGKVTEDSAGGELHTDFSLVRSGDRWVIGNAVDLR